MTKITTTPKSLTEAPKKFCKIILTEDKASWHRLVETKEGTLEYRMGIGKFDEVTTRNYRTIIRSIIQTAKSHQLENIALELHESDFKKLTEKGSEWFNQTLATNLSLANYEYTHYKTKKKEDKNLKEILVCGVATPAEKHTTRALPLSQSDKSSLKARSSFSAGLVIAEATNTTRDIANASGEDMTPVKLAAAAKDAVKGTKVSVKVLDEKQIKQQKMGLVTAVGKGADDRERFIIMEYWGKKKPTAKDTDKSLQPIILVGKGITYDTGGLNVKPSGSMHDMHLDMSGGAAMIGTMKAIAKLGLKKNVVALIPAAENSVSAKSMRAGDIFTSLSGKTVEILHTDAEGRLVLADALTYAQKHYKPALLIDAATLTGAALVALGQHASAVMTKDKKLQDTLVELGEETGDLTWPLPLWDEYKASLKSTRADLANIAVNFSRWGGTIEGGTFLSFFVDKKIPWAHIDIAPRMESIGSDKLAKGATGEPVQLLVELIKKH